MIVCSRCGGGRPGVYIALDHIFQALKAGDDHIDVYGVVHQMRQHRMSMVQTEVLVVAMVSTDTHIIHTYIYNTQTESESFNPHVYHKLRPK